MLHYRRDFERFGFSITVLAVAFLMLGCGDSDGLNHIPIHGEIRGVDGRSGSLTLIPGPGLDAPAATAPIIAGKYRFDNTNGPIPGAYEAIIALDGARQSATASVDEPVKEDKVVEFTKRQGRTFASFDVGVDERRVSLSVSESEPLEVNIDLP